MLPEATCGRRSGRSKRRHSGGLAADATIDPTANSAALSSKLRLTTDTDSTTQHSNSGGEHRHLGPWDLREVEQECELARVDAVGHASVLEELVGSD